MKVDINALEAIGSRKSQPNQNPHFDAPYVEKDGSKENQKIKVKLHQDPTKDQPKSSSEFILWSGNTAEGYCKWCKLLKHYIEYRPLDTPAKKFNGVTELLYGEICNEWQTILDGLASQDMDESFQKVLDEFVLIFMEEMACADQKWFMWCHLGRPQEMSLKMLWTCLNKMNQYIKYMPGDKKALDDDELVDIFIYSHKKWYCDLMTKSDFKYWLKSSRDVINYISRLSLIEGMVQQGHQNGMTAAKMPHKGQTIQSKHKKQCNYCHKYWHVKAKCCKKKHVEKEKAQTKTEENHAMEAEAYDSNEDLVQFLNDNFPKEVSEDEFFALMLYLLLAIHH